VLRRLPATVAAGTLALVAVSGCGDGDGGETTTKAAAAADTQGPAPGCRKVAAPAPKGEQRLQAPAAALDPAKSWTATVQTSCGTFVIDLDAKANPKTAASFAALARSGFYDGLTFHRIVDGFVIQGGDPLGNGQGGPGYSVREAPPKGTKYTRGAVAMAKTQTEPAGTSGSQFFVVTGDDAGLPPDYAVAGRVASGLPVVERIGAVPVDPATEQPVGPVVIEKVTVAPS
jgi:peptidyl-prolyl cis-trans isomerase B (cyclophilin B)